MSPAIRMWSLANDPPYAAEGNWTRDKNGVHHWIVAVRATYAIGPTGSRALADEQVPPDLAPQYFGEPGKTSLRIDSDLLGKKVTTDVLVLAQAHAPGGRAATMVPVSLRVGEIDKTLLVHGMRVYYRGLMGMTTTPPKPFVSQPIRYESAFGGIDASAADPRKHPFDARNPVGRGFSVDASTLHHRPAHLVEHPSSGPIAKPAAGYGA